MSEKSTVNIDKDCLRRAVDDELSAGPLDLDSLWNRLVTSGPAGVNTTSKFNIATVALYLGAFIATLAVSVFVGSSWSQYGSGVGLTLVILYFLVAVGVSELLRSQRLLLPSALTALVAVGVTPLVVYAFQDVTNTFGTTEFADYASFYSWASSVWLVMEVVTALAALGAYYRYRNSILLLPLMVVVSFFTLDFGSALAGDGGRLVLSLLVTLAAGGAGFVLDRKNLRPEGFWLWLTALVLLPVTLGLAGDYFQWSTSVGAVLSLVLGLGVIGLGVHLHRTLHLVFGGSMLFWGLGYLAFDVFGDTLLFAPALGLIGLSIVFGGIVLGRTRGRRAQRA